jgi:hypothetical protein
MPTAANHPNRRRRPGESRSLKACYELLENGWSAGNIRHVDGGFQTWRYKDMPMESTLDD